MKKSFRTIFLGLALLTATACGTKTANRAQSTSVVDTASDTTMVEGATPTGDGSSSKLLKAPTEQFGPMDVTPDKGKKPAQESKDSKPAAKIPDVVSITAHSETPLKVSPTSSGNEKIISTLSGKLVVEKVEPTLASSNFNLAGISDAAIASPDLGQCKLLAKNFDATDGGTQIAFTLMGMDEQAAPSADGCLVKLSTMSMAGFVVEFKNVRLGGPLTETVIPLVRLTVAPVAPTAPATSAN